jgi:hypothetical protein
VASKALGQERLHLAVVDDDIDFEPLDGLHHQIGEGLCAPKLRC